MKFSLVQFNAVVGDIAGNTKRIISFVENSTSDVVVFPELSIIGYCPEDLLLRTDVVKMQREAVDRIISRVSGKVVVLGFVDYDADSSMLYNACCVFYNGKILGVHRKNKLPTYSVFDETRWFTPGETGTIVEIHGKRFGLCICEDAWYPDLTSWYKEQGVDGVIVIAASPYEVGKQKMVEDILVSRHSETGLALLYVNQVGGQDGIVYYGHSLIVQDGRVEVLGPDFEEKVVVVEFNDN